MLGQLLNIQRFCTQDGPGIRTTVFLKGCPLRCAWCSNPESQAGQVQYAIDAQICQGCQTCRHVCPHGAVEVLQSGVCAIAQELCRSCGACHGACPAQAVKRYGYAATVEEVLAEVLRDMPYYRRTGGGLTVSGGEPAVQWQFTRELLRRAKEAGVGTLVETAGAVGWEQLWAALEEADIVYFDLKFASSELHKRYTGMDNALILDNLRNTSARKENLVEYGFRLPAAKDNRPLRFEEFEQMMGTTVYISATPADYELMKSEGVVVEQLIRPTGLVDPPLEVRVTMNQIDDLLEEIDKRVKNDDKVLVTTITKRMAEELSKYFDRVGVRNRYIHSDVDTLERIQILEDLRAGMFDVLVGVNLLREGLDLPEVALVAILDADKEGFLRNVRSLTQIAGRAARHSQGNVILYADTCTDSMRYAIEQSNRRREKQVRYNMEHGMLPRRAQRSGSGQSTLLTTRTDVPEIAAVYPIAEDHYMAAADVQKTYAASENLDALIVKAREDMERAAKSLDFLAAAKFRDRMYELQKLREENRNQNSQFTIHNS